MKGKRGIGKAEYMVSFLVADTQLYKRLCPSVGRLVGPWWSSWESAKTRISAPAHLSATGIGRVSRLVALLLLPKCMISLFRCGLQTRNSVRDFVCLLVHPLVDWSVGPWAWVKVGKWAFLNTFCICLGHWGANRVGRPCPPICNDIVTPQHLFITAPAHPQVIWVASKN